MSLAKREKEREEEQARTEEQPPQMATGRLSSMLGSKSSTIGHFLQNKQMVFDPYLNTMVPESTGDPTRVPPLVDLSVLKKAGHTSVTNRQSKGAVHRFDETALKIKTTDPDGKSIYEEGDSGGPEPRASQSVMKVGGGRSGQARKGSE